MTVSYIAGIIVKADELKFKRMVFRISRGNALVHTTRMPKIKGIDGGSLGVTKVEKVVFILTFQAGKAMKRKLQKVAEVFSYHTYNMNHGNIQRRLNKLDEDLADN